MLDIDNILINIGAYPLSYVEFVGTIFGLLCVWLAAKEHILTWPAGLVNIICLFAIFFQVHLYSDMFLQIFFFVVSIYGWVIWVYHEKVQKSVVRLNWKWRIIYFSTILIFSLVIGWFMQDIHNIFPSVFEMPAAFPFLDTFVAVASIAATILLARRVMENWILWVLIDMLCVWIYTQKNILFLALEYFVLLLVAIYGSYLWMKSSNTKK